MQVSRVTEGTCSYLGAVDASIHQVAEKGCSRNPAYLTREEGCSAVAKARREDGSTTSTMMSAEISTPTRAAAWSAAFGAATTPGAADRPPSTLTIMVSHRPQLLSIHNPAEATRPATPSRMPE